MGSFAGWRKNQKRWVWKICGQLEARSARQLQRDFPELVSGLTEAGTMNAARRWKTARRQELEAAAILKGRSDFQIRQLQMEHWLATQATEAQIDAENVNRAIPRDAAVQNAIWQERLADASTADG